MKRKCCICGKEIAGYGNNGFPAINGDVCDHCNQAIVIPLRVFENALTGQRNVAILIKEDSIELKCPKGKFFTLKELQESVNGYIELAQPAIKGCLTVVNEEGLIKRLPYNYLAKVIFNYDLVGNVLICPVEIFESAEEE